MYFFTEIKILGHRDNGTDIIDSNLVEALDLR
jgi:hypothetical protein